MKRGAIFAVVVAIVTAAFIASHRGGDENAQPVRAIAAQPEIVPRPQEQPPAPLVPQASPPGASEKMPSPIVNALAQVHAQEMHRPMNRVAKNWYGCATAEGYAAAMTQIRNKDPGSAAHFKGADADCAPLTLGAHITVMRQDEASGLAQISVNETRQVLWTDMSALAGDDSTQSK